MVSNRFSDAQHVLAEARRLIEHPPVYVPPPPRQRTWSPPPADEPEPPPRGLDTAPVDWDARIAAAVAAARAEVLAQVAAERTAMLEALADVWQEQREQAADQLADEIRLVRAELGARISEAIAMVATERAERAAKSGTIIDTHPLLSRRDVN